MSDDFTSVYIFRSKRILGLKSRNQSICRIFIAQNNITDRDMDFIIIKAICVSYRETNCLKPVVICIECINISTFVKSIARINSV